MVVKAAASAVEAGQDKNTALTKVPTNHVHAVGEGNTLERSAQPRTPHATVASVWATMHGALCRSKVVSAVSGENTIDTAFPDTVESSSETAWFAKVQLCDQETLLVGYWC